MIDLPAHYVGEAAADEGIRLIAKSIADEIIAAARNSGTDPIAWVTGSSYVPAMRSFPAAEAVWQARYPDRGEWRESCWVALVEEVERLVEEANVDLGTPDYDNALYAVDLERFVYRDEDTEAGENLQDEWRPFRFHRWSPSGARCTRSGCNVAGTGDHLNDGECEGS